MISNGRFACRGNPVLVVQKIQTIFEKKIEMFSNCLTGQQDTSVSQ